MRVPLRGMLFSSAAMSSIGTNGVMLVAGTKESSMCSRHTGRIGHSRASENGPLSLGVAAPQGPVHPHPAVVTTAALSWPFDFGFFSVLTAASTGTVVTAAALPWPFVAARRPWDAETCRHCGAGAILEFGQIASCLFRCAAADW
jgi:hypothetical protein